MDRSVDIDRFSFYTTLTSLVFLALLPSLFPCAILAPIFAYFVYIWFELFGHFLLLFPRECSTLASTVPTIRTYTKRSPPSQTLATANRKYGRDDGELMQKSPPFKVPSPPRQDYGRDQNWICPSPQPTQVEESSSSPDRTIENTQLSSSNDSEDADELVKEALQPPVNNHPRELREEEKGSSDSPPTDPSEGSNRGSNVSVKFIQVQAKRVD